MSRNELIEAMMEQNQYGKRRMERYNEKICGITLPGSKRKSNRQRRIEN